MPKYRASHNLPKTFSHIVKVLAKINKEEWQHVRDAAANALKHGGLEDKIRPSVLKQIAELDRPQQLISLIADEHIGHADHTSEVHLGGGIHHGVVTLLKTVWNMLAPSSLRRLFKKDKPIRKLSQTQIDAARMISGSYKSDRPESVGDWKRLAKYDSAYGTVWQHGDQYFVACRGTRLKFRDLFRDGKILAGVEDITDDAFEKAMGKFLDDHPGAKFSAGGHSLGTSILMTAMEKRGIDNVSDLYLFNPASSFSQSEDYIKKTIDNPKVDLFLNSNDPVSAFFAQNLGDDKNVWWEQEFKKNPASSHSLQQWIGDEGQNQDTSETEPPKVVEV